MKPSAQKTALLIFWMAIACPFALAQQDHKSWSDYGGGPDTSRFTALDQIKKSNVKQLQVAWTYFNGNSAMNPIVSHGVMYVYGRNNSLIALDAATGKEIWIHTGLSSIAELGVNYWESKDGKDRRLIFQINHFLEEIDARTGKSILSFGEDGLVDMREGLDRVPAEVARIKSDAPGRVFENLIIEGSSTGENFLAPPGHIRAYDVLTGKTVWTFHTVPYPGEFGYDTWPKDAWRYIGGVNDWGELSLDEKRGIVYVVLGSPTYDLYGADRIGAGLFGDSLVALDARTGKRLWHFQEVHHDLWDSDPCSAPQLITVRHNGKMVDAVAQAGKTGFLYVFDRVTGEPLWPIEERPVPQSDVPGEQAWPTQPFPTAPPPFARQKMTADDINPFFLTPEERATWKEKIAAARNEGLFTPAGYKRDTVQLPGSRGGSNRGTSASDPTRGLVFVTTSDFPSLINIQGPELPVTASTASARGPGGVPVPPEYQQNCQSCHGADLAGSAEAPIPGRSYLAHQSLRFHHARPLRQGTDARPPGFEAGCREYSVQLSLKRRRCCIVSREAATHNRPGSCQWRRARRPLALVEPARAQRKVWREQPLRRTAVSRRSRRTTAFVFELRVDAGSDRPPVVGNHLL